MNLTIGLNGDAGLERVLDDPAAVELLQRTRAELTVWSIKCVPGLPRRTFRPLPGTTEPRRETAHYEDLCRVDFFRRCDRLGIPLLAHQGATKPYDQHGDRLRDEMRAACDGARSAGGHLTGFTLDSPLRHGLKTGDRHKDIEPLDGYFGAWLPSGSSRDQAIETLGGVIANFAREARDRGAWYALHDAWPGHSLEAHQAFIGHLIDRGVPPKRFIFDVDLQAFSPNYKRSYLDVLFGRKKHLDLLWHRPAIRQFCQTLQSWGVEVACTILASGEIRGATRREVQQLWADRLCEMNAKMRALFGDGTLTHLDVTSWVTETGSGEDPDSGERWIPPALPVTDPSSHLGVLPALMHTWGA